jgi:dTDP-4-amino-4,6-dideoxygalactose transaminase
LIKWTEARQRLATHYTEAFTASGFTGNGLMLPTVDARAEAVCHLYVLCTPQRDGLIEHLRTRGIEAGVHYPVPLHLQPAYAHLEVAAGSLPVTELVANTCVSLPIYPEMTEAQQDLVIAETLAFLDAAG